MSTNQMTVEFDSRSENEAFARVAVSAFAAQLDPTVDELSDIRTAVSEAVTNSIIHGYEEKQGSVSIQCVIDLDTKEIEITVMDQGVGIEDIQKAMEPLYTTKPELERSGMGFVFMEVFMDELAVESEKGKGCTIRMKKKIGNNVGK